MIRGLSAPTAPFLVLAQATCFKEEESGLPALNPSHLGASGAYIPWPFIFFPPQASQPIERRQGLLQAGGPKGGRRYRPFPKGEAEGFRG